MKRTILFLTLIVTAVICHVGLAVTVTYGTSAGAGARDWNGIYLPNGCLVELRWAGVDDAIGGGDDQVVDTTSIGFGFRLNGEWWKPGVNVGGDAGMEGSLLYVRTYDAATAEAATFSTEGMGVEFLYEVPSQTPPTPCTIYCDHMRTAPEPSMFFLLMLSLPFLRRKILK